MKKISITVKKNEEKIVPFVCIHADEEIDVQAELTAEGGDLHIVGIFIGKASQKIIFNTTVVHRAKKTKSRITLRGVFFNNASFSSDGMIRINKGAAGADAYFTSKVLLFDDAKGRSVPSLEIDENDLKAGHASTVGRPDKEQLFYLQSRGISEKQAVGIIVSGFFEPLIKFFAPNDQKIIRGKISAYEKY